MKIVNNRLNTIEHKIKQHVQSMILKRKQGLKEDQIESQGSLQAHLYNAQYILDLMDQDAKPLLVFLPIVRTHYSTCTDQEQSKTISHLKKKLSLQVPIFLNKKIFRFRLTRCPNPQAPFKRRLNYLHRFAKRK